MNTLFDFVSHNKGIEYLLALMFIAGFVVLMEVLKPHPFRAFVSAVKEDWSYLRGAEGASDTMRMAKNAMVLPIVAGMYVAMIPVMFALGLALKLESTVADLVGGGAMSWRPLESYLTGRGRKVRKSRKDEKKEN